MARKKRLGLRAHFLQFYFRDLKEPFLWGASKEDWEALGQALGDSSRRFFSFEDPSGLIVSINLGMVQLARCTWEAPAERGTVVVPDGIRVHLTGREPMVLPFAEKKPIGLAGDLDGLEDDDDAIQWLAENELIAMRVDELLYLEYPTAWEAAPEGR